MAEILDLDGIWSMDLVELMLPVAVELEANDTERTFGAVASAAASLFSKVPGQKLGEQLRQTRARVRERQLEARGIAAAESSKVDAATGFMKIFGKMGLKPTKRRGKSGSAGATRIHRGK